MAGWRAIAGATVPDWSVRAHARCATLLPHSSAEPDARRRDWSRTIHRASDLQRAPIWCSARGHTGREDHIDYAGTGQLPAAPALSRAADAVAVVATHER